MNTLLGTLLSASLLASSLSAHEPTPDPTLFYNFSEKHLALEEGQPPVLKPQFGPLLEFSQAPMKDEHKLPGLRFKGLREAHSCIATNEQIDSLLPTREFTVSAWFTVDEAKDWGGLLSVFQDNGTDERGLVLGYNNSGPYIGLSTVGADDGNGLMTYLSSSDTYEFGRWHHIAATYDGRELLLFWDGKKVAESTAQSGDILWPKVEKIFIGGYRDSNENNPHAGRIGTLKLFHVCANESWVTKEFENGKSLNKQEADTAPPAPPEVVVQPYLQWVRRTEATVMWETAHPCKGKLHWGLGSDCDQVAEETEERTLHQITLTNLEPEMLYYYQAESPNEGESFASEISTFQTAPKEETPLGFVVFCDCQANPQVVERISKAAWQFRPQFLVVGGDLVTTGKNKSHWTEHFFPHARPLISRVPFYPVLGNHEQNASYYYDYMKLPEPEYYYTFRYNEVQFFMLDSNKSLAPDSEQFQWLDSELQKSDARWKICVHHHPPFSSDDDYGNDWKRPVSQMKNGDTNARSLVTLYDKHKVDIVWTGHIHSYERTWLLRDGQPVERDGTMYLVTGGAGGGLEQFGPYRPAFQRQVKTGHHFCYVTSFKGEFDVKAYDLDGRMFDHFTLRK